MHKALCWRSPPSTLVCCCVACRVVRSAVSLPRAVAAPSCAVCGPPPSFPLSPRAAVCCAAAPSRVCVCVYPCAGPPTPCCFLFLLPLDRGVGGRPVVDCAQPTGRPASPFQRERESGGRHQKGESVCVCCAVLFCTVPAAFSSAVPVGDSMLIPLFPSDVLRLKEGEEEGDDDPGWSTSPTAPRHTTDAQAERPQHKYHRSPTPRLHANNVGETGICMMGEERERERPQSRDGAQQRHNRAQPKHDEDEPRKQSKPHNEGGQNKTAQTTNAARRPAPVCVCV